MLTKHIINVVFLFIIGVKCCKFFFQTCKMTSKSPKNVLFFDHFMTALCNPSFPTCDFLPFITCHARIRARVRINLHTPFFLR